MVQPVLRDPLKPLVDAALHHYTSHLLDGPQVHLHPLPISRLLRHPRLIGVQHRLAWAPFAAVLPLRFRGVVQREHALGRRREKQIADFGMLRKRGVVLARSTDGFAVVLEDHEGLSPLVSYRSMVAIDVANPPLPNLDEAVSEDHARGVSCRPRPQHGGVCGAVLHRAVHVKGLRGASLRVAYGERRLIDLSHAPLADLYEPVSDRNASSWPEHSVPSRQVVEEVPIERT
mmetsp:Transcript_26420/g.75858  ORF Transcript_26420/g.75858 Transcript_26420/m.75858 type:complete len:231 (+) Transcript_26420:2132-2824(+)